MTSLDVSIVDDRVIGGGGVAGLPCRAGVAAGEPGGGGAPGGGGGGFSGDHCGFGGGGGGCSGDQRGCGEAASSDAPLCGDAGCMEEESGLSAREEQAEEGTEESNIASSEWRRMDEWADDPAPTPSSAASGTGRESNAASNSAANAASREANGASAPPAGASKASGSKLSLKPSSKAALMGCVTGWSFSDWDSDCGGEGEGKGKEGMKAREGTGGEGGEGG